MRLADEVRGGLLLPQAGLRVSAGKRLAIAAAYAAFLVTMAEIVAWPAGEVLGAKWWTYRDPDPKPDGISLSRYLAVRDPVLGWPSRSEFGRTYAPDGSRWCKGPVLAPGGGWAVSLYGDSFTADWVGGDTDHWGCRMQQRLAATVKNYGVGGYGTDQSLLRYQANAGDKAAIVILGHMSENIARNLTRYRDFHTRSQDWAFKPRFVLDSRGELSLVAIPAMTEADYRRFIGVDLPQLVLPHENFAPGGPAGAVRHEFPHLVSLLRNLGHWEVRARLAGLPTYAPFYDTGHPLQGLQLTTAIMLAFEREASRRGQKSMLVLFPGPDDIRHHRKSGRWLYQSLIDALRAAGASPYNFGEPLLEHLGQRPVETVFQNHHYTREVSHLVADSLAAELGKRGWAEVRPGDVRKH
jgi:hypothetical protein